MFGDLSRTPFPSSEKQTMKNAGVKKITYEGSYQDVLLIFSVNAMKENETINKILSKSAQIGQPWPPPLQEITVNDILKKHLFILVVCCQLYRQIAVKYCAFTISEMNLGSY